MLRTRKGSHQKLISRRERRSGPARGLGARDSVLASDLPSAEGPVPARELEARQSVLAARHAQVQGQQQAQLGHGSGAGV